jgi:hypothetical protein
MILILPDFHFVETTFVILGFFALSKLTSTDIHVIGIYFNIFY